MISQWSGKEMCNFFKIILGRFTVALSRSADQQRPNGDQLEDYNRAIWCMRNISEFYLMIQYTSHTDQTVSYIQKYLQSSHETNDVFLRFCVVKKTKRATAAAHKSILNKQTQEFIKGLTMSKKPKCNRTIPSNVGI